MAESKFSIRILNIDDYQQLIQLWTSTPGVGLRSFDDSETGIRKFLDRNPNTCFTAECDGEMAGAILSGHDGRRGYIYHATVREKDRRKGIGIAMLEAVEKAMKDEGITRIGLVAFAHNESGNLFWEKQGYIIRPDLVYRNKSINDKNV